MEKFDWIVIGGGSAGLSVIETALQFNKKCLLIEPNPLGGTCVNVGCVPKKMMWYLNEVYAKATLLKDYQIGDESNTQKLEISFAQFVKKRQEVITNINKWYEKEIAEKATHIKGKASFESSHVVKVGDKLFKGEKIVISTGSAPVYPKEIEGHELGITSDGFFELQEIPISVSIVGSGYIALELASVIATLQKIKYKKTHVNVIVRSQRTLRKVDEKTALILQEQLAEKGIQFIFNTSIEKINKKEKLLEIKLDTKSAAIQSEKLIWAIGREPNVEQIKLEKANINTDKRGFINVNENFETSSAQHYAIGDVINKPQLTPVAIQCGRRLVRQIHEDKEKNKVNFDHVPTAIFTHPPLATIGISSEKAKEQNIETEEFETQFTPMIYNFSSHSTQTYIKLICEKQTQKVIGLHMVGDGVDEILQGFAVAIKMGATKKDFDTTFAIHPTSAEEIVTLKPIA